MPSAPDALIDIAVRHSFHFERLKTHESNKFDPFLVDMDAKLRAALTATDITGLSRSKAERQIKAIGNLMTESYNDYYGVWVDGVSSAAVYEAEFEARSLTEVVDNFEFQLPSDNQIIAAVMMEPLGDIKGIAGGSLLKGYFDNESAASVKKIENAIRLGYASGDTTGKILQKVRGTKAARYKNGIFAGSKRSAEQVVKTALQHASSQARERVWDKNKSIVESTIIIAVFDRRTSLLCRGLDGKTVGGGIGMPPYHIKCRTTMVAKLNDRYAFLSEGRTKAARGSDGKIFRIDAKTTQYDYIKNQPIKMQESVLGKARSKLMRDGGLSRDRFAELNINNDFTPATLDDMRKLEPAAFERAGL